jgi:outer membrane protein TolC
MAKYKNPIIWYMAVLCILFNQPSVAQDRLSLPEAVARALESNPDLAIDEPGRQAAQAEFDAAAGGYLPRLDFEQSYLAGNNPAFVFSTLLTQEKFTEANFDIDTLNAPDAEDNWQARFTLQQTIWDFGRTRTHREMARLGVEKADRSHEDHVRGVVLAVIEAYYATTLARESLETARIALQSAEAIESQAESRVNQGLAVEADLLRSRVYLSSAKQRKIEAEGNLENARARLNRLMGRPLSQSVGETAALLPFDISVPSEEALLAEQKQRRPDYQNLLTELKEAELAVQARKKEFLPVLAGYGTWEIDNPLPELAGGNNWAAGVSLNWNLFAGGSDKARLDASRFRLEQKRRQIRAMESVMALEIRSAVVQYRSAEQQVAAARAAEAQSEEGLRILNNRYEAGLATMTDLLSAETARSSARTGLTEAVYRQRLSYARLEYVAGTLSPTSPAVNLQ